MSIQMQDRMSWSINEVVRMTGLTSRALRHYDAIGLLVPAWTTEGGRRHYGKSELLRLQEILLLRSLGLRLDTIAEVLADRSDEERIGVLARHRRQLEKERERIDRLINTVSRTIQNLEEQGTMEPDDMFDGLIEDPYEPEARKLYGDEAIDEAKERIRRLNKEDRELLTSGRGFQDVHQRLAELKKQGLPVDDPRVQEIIERHYEIVSWVWTPNAETYVALGQGYVSDEGFRKNIGQGDDSLVTYLAEGMKVYAAEKLKP
jgi:DNA-binding transcriptional MerR regulator